MGGADPKGTPGRTGAPRPTPARSKKEIRQAFRPQAYEILTDELQILVPRLFVPLNLRVLLITLY